MKKILLFSAMLFSFWTLSNSAMAQSRSVSGKVTSGDDGSSLPGVNVVVKGTTNGTITNADGEYQLTVDGENVILVFSFVGLTTQEISVGSRSVIDISMESDVTQLSEVVVTGYGEVAKEAFTGASGEIASDQLENIPLVSADQMLQGNVAGVQLSASSGTPGSTQDIRIRGISSITANNEPLFVIDGMPVVSGTNQSTTATGSLSVLSSINPNDIESMTVLKDASATALYGARGANGVIVITTKRGKSGKAKISFNAQYGTVERATEGPKMLNADQWEELYYESLVNAGFATDVDDAIASFPSGRDGDTDTDWKKVIARDPAITSTYSIDVSGGTENTQYLASVGYFKQEGINIGTGYERVTGKIGLTQKINDKLKFSNNTTASFAEQNGQLEGSAYFGNPEMSYLFMNPIEKARNDDGTPNLNFDRAIVFNPLYVQNNSISRRKQTRIINSTDLTFNIIENLNFTTSFGVDYISNEELNYDDPFYGDAAADGGSSYAYYNRNFNWVWKNILDYSIRVSDRSKFNLKFVYEAQKNTNNNIGTGGIGIASSGLYYPSSVATPDFASGSPTDWKINSYMGLINYNFKGNLFIDATLRREGNSRFSEGNRWGTFYSLGASWIFSDESFMSGMDWLSMGKLRASYGLTGNAGVGLNRYQSLLAYDAAYDNQPGSYPSEVGNDALTWEKNASLNLGLDFGLFGIINGSIDYFSRESSDLLLSVPLSRTTGFASQIQNVGKMKNSGIEVALNADVISTDKFNWNIGFNFTTLENEVTELPIDGNGEEIGIETGTRKTTVGQPVNAWYMRTWAGVDPDTGAPQWYLDGVSGETTSVWSDALPAFQGGSALPTFYGGINTTLSYQGFYASANLYHSAGNKVYDSWAFYTQSDGANTFTIATGYASQMDRWQKPGDISSNPVNVYGNSSRSSSTSSRRLHDGDYWRLRNVTFGYNFPSAWVNKINLNNVNLYFRGTNLWTKAKSETLEFDPEVNAAGFLDISAPPLKSLVIGLKVDF